MKLFLAIIFSVLPLLVLGCESKEDRESEARALFNLAISQWEDGKLALADKNFEKIEKNYLDTEMASEAVIERRNRKAKYKESLKMSELLQDINNTRYKEVHKFSPKVFESIETYKENYGEYPETLSLLSLFKKAEYEQLLEHCKYKRAYFNFGFKLDCSKADFEYLVLEDEKRLNRMEEIRNAKRKSNARKKFQRLDEFELTKSTWGDKLNPSKRVPSSGFKVFYMNEGDKKEVIDTEVVKDISINYAYDDFKGIRSEDFAAYWVGYLNVDSTTLKKISISQSWSKMRLTINKRVVYEGKSKSELVLQLDKGKYLVEVEYINNWHTTTASVRFLDEAIKYNFEETKSLLKKNVLTGFDVYYAGAYTSSNKDMSIVLNLKRSDKDMVLLLSSYEAVKWEILNPYRNNIKAIVFSSFTPGALITGEVGAKTKLIPFDGRFGVHSGALKCQCTSGRYHCSGDSVMPIVNKAKKLTSKELKGYSVNYSSDFMTLPEVAVDEAYLKDYKKMLEKNNKDREKCSKANDPDFDDFLKS